jgi:DNA repair exonuclease SbcCD ATPase subunit
VKLKLEPGTGGAKILSVTESIAAQQVPMLKAGLGKLFESGESLILLDLTTLPRAMLQDKAVLAGIQDIKSWSLSLPQELFVASSVPELSDALSVSELQAMVQSPLARLLASETKYKARLDELTRKKAELEKSLTSLDAEGAKLRAQRQTNTQLKKLITRLEAVLKVYEKERKPVVDMDPALKTKLDQVEKTLKSILQTNGVIS